MRPPHSWSIRARITAGSLVISAIVLVFTSLAVHAQLRTITRDSDESLATADLTSIAAEIESNPRGPLDEPSVGTLVVVRDPQGANQVQTVPHEVQEAVSRREGGNETFTVREDGTEYVVVARIVETSDGAWQLWAARSTAASDLTVRAMDTTLVAGTLLVLAAFGGAAWLLASAALRPVARMRETADSLSRGAGDAELPVGTANDELSALATTLNRFINRVRATADRERQMVSDASHELRTPLAVVQAQLELAHASFGDADALKREILAVEVSLARLSRLATTLLELSRLDAAQSEGSPGRGETASGSELVTELMLAIDRARLLAGSADIAVDFEVGDVTGDFALSPTAFGRVVDNLVGNALAATARTSGLVVELRERTDGVRLTVADTGTGIPEDFLPRAFDRFSRPDSSRERSADGSGLGLALVQAITERAGGAVTLANRPGGGAVATVDLPKR